MSQGLPGGREGERPGQRWRAVRYAVTRLGAACLRALVRGQGALEHRRHGVRAVTLGEDGCRVRTGAAPAVLAALRNVVLALLRQRGVQNGAAARTAGSRRVPCASSASPRSESEHEKTLVTGAGTLTAVRPGRYTYPWSC